jgi:hypothetical protein
VTINGRHSVDLMFHRRILRCFVLIDLKLGEVQHHDIGQMNRYLGYFANEENNGGAALVDSRDLPDVPLQALIREAHASADHPTAFKHWGYAPLTRTVANQSGHPKRRTWATRPARRRRAQPARRAESGAPRSGSFGALRTVNGQDTNSPSGCLEATSTQSSPPKRPKGRWQRHGGS